MQIVNTIHPASAIQTFQWRNTPIETAVELPEKAMTYADYLTDSLNPARPDTNFNFELKNITYPSDSLAEAKSEKIFPSFIITEPSGYGEKLPINRKELNHDWITILIFLGIGLLALIKHFYPRRLKQIFLATYAKRYVGQLARDGNLNRERISPGLGFIAAVSFSTIIYGFTEKTGILNMTGFSEVKVFLLIAAGIAILWFLRRAIITLTGFLYRSYAATDIFQLNDLLFTIAPGVVIFPIAIGWFFTKSDYLLYAGGVIIVIFMIGRLYRNLIGGFQVQSFSGIYFFLYFCTLEILPLAIGFKIYKILLQ
ncbi:MAG: DUF4271 domain-containing protein [Lentimicrobium sp.]|nr:DUF4271 domain-containing protein [Lentimicrobium sp.]